MRRSLVLSSVVFVAVASGVACGGSPPPEPVAPTAPAPVASTPPVDPAPATPPKAEPPQKTLAQKMEETTKALVEAWNVHDADKIAATYSENGSLRVVGMPDMTGRPAIKAAAMDSLKAFPDFKVSVTRVIVKGNQAFVEWVISGTNNGDSEMMKLKATKRPMGLYGVDVATYDDSGLIKESHRYFDMPTQMQQLDAKAKAGTFRPIATSPSGAPTVAIAKGTPAEQKNLDAMKEFDKAWDSHKSDAVLAVSAPEMTVEDYAMPAALKGAKAQKPVLDMMFKALPDMKTEINVRIAADDFVATEHTDTGTMKGNMGPVKATNKPVTMHMVDIVQVKDGKAAAVWAYGNSMEMMPPPAAAPAKDEKKPAPAKK